VKKRILVAALLIFGSFIAGRVMREHRQHAAIIISYISYTITSYNEDGTILPLSKVVRVCNRQGEWCETQMFPDGRASTGSGQWMPSGESLASFPEAPRKEILGRTVVVLFDRRSENWYDPSLHQFLKHILYTDETRQTVSDVIEAVELKESDHPELTQNHQCAQLSD
jgi:hypothetical protein